SHECDHPPGLEDVAVLTSSRVPHSPSSAAIDGAVRDLVRQALAVYDIDVAGLRAARPDVIVTQDLCDVCAVSLDDVRAAVARLAQADVRIVNLRPERLEHIFDDVLRVAEALDRRAEGEALCGSLRGRVAVIAARAAAAVAASGAPPPTVLSVEWM